MSSRRPSPIARIRGFTVLEMAVTVSVIGMLTVLASSFAGSILDVRNRARAEAEAEVARQAVLRFLLQNKRLPCPDLSAGGKDAREGAAGGCAAGAQVGWLPYESLGLPLPGPEQRLRYAVARRAPDADLVQPQALAGDIDGIGRLRAALANAAQLPPGSDRPYLTGRGTPADPEGCGHISSNPAFALIAPVSDRDDVGSLYPGFDGINQAMAASNARCIAAPGRAMDARYDDVVLAESANALLGWIAASTR